MAYQTVFELQEDLNKMDASLPEKWRLSNDMMSVLKSMCHAEDGQDYDVDECFRIAYLYGFIQGIYAEKHGLDDEE